MFLHTIIQTFSFNTEANTFCDLTYKVMVKENFRFMKPFHLKIQNDIL